MNSDKRFSLVNKNTLYSVDVYYPTDKMEIVNHKMTNSLAVILLNQYLKLKPVITKVIRFFLTYFTHFKTIFFPSKPLENATTGRIMML